MGLKRGPSKDSSERHKQVANDVLHKGKPFKQAMLAAGYSANVADLGPKFMRSNVPGLNMAFVEASKELAWQPDEVRAIVRSRLLSDVTAGKSSGLERACELLGRDKTIDMWVRNADVQIGIFGSLGDEDGKLLLEATAPDPPIDKD